MPVAAVPLSTPVAELNVTPVGKFPNSVRVGAGVPVVVTVNVPCVPTVKVALAPLVIDGGFGQLFTRLLTLTVPIPVAKSQPLPVP